MVQGKFSEQKVADGSSPLIKGVSLMRASRLTRSGEGRKINIPHIGLVPVAVMIPAMTAAPR